MSQRNIFKEAQQGLTKKFDLAVPKHKPSLAASGYLSNHPQTQKPHDFNVIIIATYVPN